MKTVLGLVDYGAGNLRSVTKALERVGGTVRMVEGPEDFATVDKVVIPGVGSFGEGMAALRARGLVEPLRTAAEAGTPILGICLGMQLLLEESEEMGRHRGLGLLPGRVRRFPDGELNVPHTGWNQLAWSGDSPLLRGLDPGAYAYFNHSYYCQPAERIWTVQTEYGLPFAAALWQDDIYGVQFHPEKSQGVGLQVLTNFVEDG